MKSQSEYDIEMCGRELTVYPPGSKPPVRFSDLVLLLDGWRQIIREKRDMAINAKMMELNEDIAERANIEADTMEVCMKMLQVRMQQNG